MNRLGVILALLMVALPGLGAGGLGGHGGHDWCGLAACRVVEPSPGCCGVVIGEERSCPMSGGTCTCDVSPTRERQPGPDTPLPRSDRESLAAVPARSIAAETVVFFEAGSIRISSVRSALLSDLTHNEVRALLGIWRT